MNSNNVVLKLKGKYYHNYFGDSFDVDTVSPGEYSSGYFKDKGGDYLSLYGPTNGFLGKVHTKRIKPRNVNGVTLWEVE